MECHDKDCPKLNVCMMIVLNGMSLLRLSKMECYKKCPKWNVIMKIVLNGMSL
jgi:hypothetical protein